MQRPLQVAFHNLPHSEALEARIAAQAAILESCYDRIQGCRVVLDQPHRHHKDGNAYQVRIDLTVPGGELVVKRDSSPDRGTDDLDALVLDAFEDLRRQLDDHVRRLRGHVKTHEPAPRARVQKLFPEQGYGFLETADGREIYFHRNSVTNGDFAHLAVGAEVAFVEESGDRGPQASTVRAVGRHNRH